MRYQLSDSIKLEQLELTVGSAVSAASVGVASGASEVSGRALGVDTTPGVSTAGVVSAASVVSGATGVPDVASDASDVASAALDVVAPSAVGVVAASGRAGTC